MTTVTQGLLHLPGSSFKTKELMQKLLKDDFDKHHCFWGKVGFHNHLPHHLLAAYDFAAPPKVLQAIYDEEMKVQSPINLVDRQTGAVAPLDIQVTMENWTEHVGQDKNYVSFLAFFRTEVERLGPVACLEEYVFSPRANGNETRMLLRFAGGAVHPLIQTGYGVEFNEPLLVASGLAQTAVSKPLCPEVFEGASISKVTNGVNGTSTSSPGRRYPSHGPSLLSIIQMMYDSDILTPTLPYQPDALLSTRIKESMTSGRPEEFRRLSTLWTIDPNGGESEFASRVEEIIWACTLLTVATSKHGRKPRVDFFLMHLLTSSLFLPSLLGATKKVEDKISLMRLFVAEILMIMLLRGRPRIDVTLVMSYPEFPQPPPGKDAPTPDESSLGDPRDPSCTNPWPAIIASVIHAPDAHTVKSVRTLYYAAQKFGETPPGGVIGAFTKDGKETIAHAGQLDGTLFVRAAGVIMNALGWVSHGQKEGNWDRSALGWDGAWDKPDDHEFHDF
ncbi:hypothetical protein SCHPADRAFT_866161 [Schizopora paradoxa]|uniref:Uncharacterized protein n=1 Tax=Schizopora paradoxa TaxID=27342 RepID=A0A0H2SNM0_9AGAM|nr:hypothetical protein SCHPADRAFT_866161 [Schizopora paradoxa]